MNTKMFNEFMSGWLRQQEIMPPKDWSEEAREWALRTGLISGDSNGNLIWKTPLTREELVQVLYRRELGAL